MLRFEYSGKQVSKLMKELNSKVKNLEPPLQGWGGYMEEETEKQFVSQVDPDGQPWAALAPSTLEQKRRQGYPDDILTRTRKMRRSVKAIASSRSVEIRIDFPAQFHQEGTDKMPQRRILGLNNERKGELRRRVRVYIGGRR